MKKQPSLLFIAAILFSLPSICQQTRDYKIEKIPKANTPAAANKTIYGSINGYIACQFPNKNLKRLELENYKLYLFEVLTLQNGPNNYITEIGHKMSEAIITQIDNHRDSLHYSIINVPVNKTYLFMLCYMGDRTPSNT